MKNLNFTFSDTIAGYVTYFDWNKDVFGLRTSDNREFHIKFTSTTYAELVRNFGEAFIDCTSNVKDMLARDRFLFAHGIFYPESEELNFEVKHIVFIGRSEDDYRFEQQDWWIKQVKSLGDFYLKAQFGDGNIDYRNYRTTLNIEGCKEGTYRQETDTISRLVYGFASAYMLTGDERFLEGAEVGTQYLRNHLRNVNTSDDTVYWYHAIDIKGDQERKIFASEFGDDYDAIPAYEQIYALAGPTQTYRITGNPEILKDIEMTVNLFDKYFIDRKLGGFFSHIDPITFDPRAESLGRDRSRKNWNSVGDHAPAYLINLWLATDEDYYKKMLKTTADLITEHFQDYEHSSFVQEKFHEDWSHDKTWGWQQNRGVVGHNLKIAWNLMRINNLIKDERYVGFAKKIADVMPEAGGDQLRGGWYDVLEREITKDQKFHRFVWHDRKAWWQQEQGILAYLILAGVLKEDEYLRLARESASFYNAWFLDHDSGGVYFNVQSNGLPYLLGTERKKGSHSMSGYHSFELAFLAAVYTNLLITKQHMDFYFKPFPNGFKDNQLRVQPDLLPTGAIKIERVWINGREYNNFDAEAMIVQLPDTGDRINVRVRIIPTSGVDHFNSIIEKDDEIIKVTLSGDIDSRALPNLRRTLEEACGLTPAKLAIIINDLNNITLEGARSIIFERQKLPLESKVFIIGANKEIKEILSQEEFTETVSFLEYYDKYNIND